MWAARPHNYELVKSVDGVGLITAVELLVKTENFTKITTARKRENLVLFRISRRDYNMKTVQISLNSIDKVKSFVNEITKYDNDFDLVSGRYVIDAKSIMGIFSLDLSKPIDLNIHADGELDDILAALEPYIIK